MKKTRVYQIAEQVGMSNKDVLAKIKEARGGKCIRCGYDKCLKALEFHHLDPSQKDFTISNDHFKLKEAVEESKKCILIIYFLYIYKKVHTK